MKTGPVEKGPAYIEIAIKIDLDRGIIEIAVIELCQRRGYW
jgi:hypothetical protein